MTDSIRSTWHPDTLAVHAGTAPDPTTGARAVPIHATTSYVFRDTAHAADLFGLRAFGNIYSRITNPTCDAFEQRIAALEGGQAALALASGQSAIALTLLHLCRAGDHVVASRTLYGGTVTLLTHTLPRWGVTTRFVDIHDLAAVRRAIDAGTRALYVETIGNPRLDVPDFAALAAIAHEAGIPLVVDNTFATPFLARPIEHGADVVVHSATKWIGGHGTAIGGVVVDGGTFDWGSNERFRSFYADPEPAYHGLKFAETFGSAAYAIRLRTVLLRNTGAALSPFNAFLFLQGLETLPLRMERHSANALAVARHLEGHEHVSWVNYPGLDSNAYHEVANRVLDGGYGGLVTFGIKGGREAGRKLIESLELFSHLANIGDAKSLAIHNATTTHSQLNEDELAASGVTQDTVRLSVGIEHVDDILGDLDQALAKSAVAVTA